MTGTPSTYLQHGARIAESLGIDVTEDITPSDGPVAIALKARAAHPGMVMIHSIDWGYKLSISSDNHPAEVELRKAESRERVYVWLRQHAQFYDGANWFATPENETKLYELLEGAK